MNTLLVKGAIIAGLILLLILPTTFIQALVRERAARRTEVVTEVSNSWAGSQLIAGPILAVPYETADTSKARIRKTAFFLPDALAVRGTLSPEVRHRGLYDVALYRSTLTLEGRFDSLRTESLSIQPGGLRWNEARLLVGISDLRGLEEDPVVTISGSAHTLEAGGPALRGGLQTLSIPVQSGAGGGTFSLPLKLRGSGGLHIAPVGRRTEVALQSSWPDPAFTGAFLPTSPTVSKAGFTAHWAISGASRPLPQAWIGGDGDPDFSTVEAGVRLAQPADGYAKTERSVKYALLFITLTFAVFFGIEALQKRPVHPVQYALVGAALCVFYTLLLSLSEYIGFDRAYGIAAAATVGLVGAYVWSLFGSARVALPFTAGLGALYSYIFVIVRLEDRALLAGSVGLFVILAALMWASRRIDWYGKKTTSAAAV